MSRALASALTHEPMVEAPKRGDDPERGPCAYWSSLLHPMIYGLGWVHPGRGLRWWYEKGKPVADHSLRLVSQVWDADGQLDWFAAWLWTTPGVLDGELLKEATGYVIDDGPPLLSDPWIEARFSEAHASGIPAPIGGGRDPLHLSDHIDGPLQPVAGKSALLRTSRAGPRAVLLLDSMIGWYRALATECKALPKLSGHSWRVDVVVKPVGWLGTYRQSSVTGLWFAGGHSVHVKGAAVSTSSGPNVRF